MIFAVLALLQELPVFAIVNKHRNRTMQLSLTVRFELARAPCLPVAFIDENDIVHRAV